MDATALVLKYSHHIIDHLGLKLYQNKPTNVIAELISNSWDADAKAAWIDLNLETGGDGTVTVIDNGHGMAEQELADAYLVIGKQKRDKATDTSRKGRNLMGRKGIGKLAPFGIARVVEILTVAKSTDGALVGTWIALDLDVIKEVSSKKAGAAIYEPVIVARSVALEKLKAAAGADADRQAFISRFLDKTKGGAGTGVLMRRLSLGKIPNADQLIGAMGRRFTVTLVNSGYEVFVNGTKVDEKAALPVFEVRIPAEGMQTATIDCPDGTQRDVNYWVGFVKQADWPQDQAGVGIYAHGKLAQDRPFTFGVKGYEIATRYMYGVVNADWLDELEEDVVSTDRTSVNWDNELAQALYNWGTKQIGPWVTVFRDQRKGEEEKENRLRIKGVREVKLTDVEEDSIVQLLGSVTPKMGKDEPAKEGLAQAVAQAWTHKPMRALVKKMWESLDKQGGDPTQFAEVLRRLSMHLVPEALSVCVTFAQRAHALGRLHELVHKGREIDLQDLISRFPWILEPSYERYHANETMKTIVQDAVEGGLSPSRFDADKAYSGKTRPDFVFHTTSGNEEILVVELKNPKDDLDLNNRDQLLSYLSYLERHHSSAKCTGVLIGGSADAFRERVHDDRLTVLGWDEVLRQSRQEHVYLLAAMLGGAGVGADDSRVREISEFGGKETVELLLGLAEHDEDLADLIREFSAPGEAPEKTK